MKISDKNFKILSESIDKLDKIHNNIELILIVVGGLLGINFLSFIILLSILF